MLNQSTVYGWMMIGGILLGLGFWWRLARRDSRLLLIYLGALGGAFLGAKLAYLAAEGWMHWHETNRWLQLATGKSITGGLMGGYVGVEIAKRLLGYGRVTGDFFALITPIGISLGRIGCWFHGCCRGIECSPAWFTVSDPQGVARWPSVQVEILFNVVALGGALALRKGRLLGNQHFHLYLMAYGAFRFMHEFMRETPRIFGALSGYQIIAVVIFYLGLAAFARRQKAKLEPRRIDPIAI